MIDKRMWASQTPLRHFKAGSSGSSGPRLEDLKLLEDPLIAGFGRRYLEEGGEEGPECCAMGVVLAPSFAQQVTNIGETSGSSGKVPWQLAGLCMGALLRSLQFGDW